MVMVFLLYYGITVFITGVEIFLWVGLNLMDFKGDVNWILCFPDTRFYYLRPLLTQSFAQFFISPLFDESCSERELMAVDSGTLNFKPSSLHVFYFFYIRPLNLLFLKHRT